METSILKLNEIKNTIYPWALSTGLLEKNGNLGQQKVNMTHIVNSAPVSNDGKCMPMAVDAGAYKYNNNNNKKNVISIQNA